MSIILVLALSLGAFDAQAWGFFGHKRINRLAVFTLPPEMVTFFKHHIQYVTENSVNPDRRRYTVPYEAPRHYIDVDVYGDSAHYKMPRYWNQAVEMYTEDTLMEYGIAPWHVNRMKFQLTDAFRRRDALAIIRLATDLGHYIGDSNVPLHTTKNYNGQYTNQIGIHGFWESRLVELYSDDYDFFVGQADYISNPQLEAWEAIINAHNALDSVLLFEKELTIRFSEEKKYSYEQRGQQTIKVYSRDFSRAYHTMLAGQVERRMRASIKMIGDFWYTCWVDAGQPNLDLLIDGFDPEKEQKRLKDELEQQEERKIKTRDHDPYVGELYDFLKYDDLDFDRFLADHPHLKPQVNLVNKYAEF